jgi:soluble lytic murein transglycosylase-like protein
MIRLFGMALLVLATASTAQARHGRHAREIAPSPDVAVLMTQFSQRYGMPETLLRRVVRQESGFNPGARHGPYWGLMQIRLDTARGVGYRGGGPGLLDAATNLTYGGAYLANAWRVSGGTEARAMRLYRGGYYYEAKRRGMLKQLIRLP